MIAPLALGRIWPNATSAPRAAGAQSIRHPATAPLRLHDGKTRGERALLHRRRRQPLPTMRGPVGLRDDSDDLVGQK